MQSSVTVEIRLFGAFRTFDTGQPIIVNVAQGAGLAEIRQALAAELTRRHPGFDRQALIGESALADDRAVLQESFRADRDLALAILPPVCGG